jgi:trans-aconitate methyltransferase
MTHEFDGQKYEVASGHQKEWGERLITELNLQGSERILDLGCGDGALTIQLSRLVPNGMVVGIDASIGMIEAAKLKKGKNVSFLLMDIDNLEFDQEFDVIFSNATLHWVKDHRSLFKRVQRLLSQAGVLRFNFAGDGNCSSFIKVIHESLTNSLFSQYFKGFVWPWYMPSVEEYRELLQEVGIKDVDVWGENADRFFPDRDAMIKWIDQPSLVPFIACVAEQHKALFRKFVVRRMIEETLQADGRYYETFRRINVYARK